MIEHILTKESSWEKLQKTDLPIVLYGTGAGADMVLDEFSRLGITVSAVAASDGFVRSRSFRGFEVKSISTLEEQFTDFVIALGFATCIPEVMENIKAIAHNHTLIVPVVPVFGDTIFNREYVESNIQKLKSAEEMLYDEESRRIFLKMAEFQFTGELSLLSDIESSKIHALADILRLTDKEHMLDLGAYRGDTIEELLRLTGGYASVLALEPDKKTFLKLCDYLADKENAEALPYAVWSENTTLTFSGGGGRQSTLCQSGKYTVQAVAVDNITENRVITYVKADVEGVEKEMLSGMRTLLRKQKPKLNIACYHRTEDLCTLIPLIHSINPEYRIHLRHHPYIPCWDTNLYCI